MNDETLKRKRQELYSQGILPTTREEDEANAIAWLTNRPDLPLHERVRYAVSTVSGDEAFVADYLATHQEVT